MHEVYITIMIILFDNMDSFNFHLHIGELDMAFRSYSIQREGNIFSGNEEVSIAEME